MTDITQPLHKEGEVCPVCGSDGGIHFGDCPKHWTKTRLQDQVLTNPQDQTGVVQHTTGYLQVANTPWFTGSEMKVTEGFLMNAIKSLTGAEVESIKYRNKSFVVRFK